MVKELFKLTVAETDDGLRTNISGDVSIGTLLIASYDTLAEVLQLIEKTPIEDSQQDISLAYCRERAETTLKEIGLLVKWSGIDHP